MAQTKQHLEHAKRRIANMIIYGVVKLIGYQGAMLTVQATGMDSEVNSNMAHPQEYGHASCPLVGAYTTSLFKGGSRDNGQVLLIYDPRYAPNDLNGGDSCAYDYKQNRVWLKGNDGILIKNGNNTVTLNDTGITINDTSGNQIILNNAGISVNTAGLPVIFNAPVVFNQGWTLDGGNGIGTGTSNISIDGSLTAATSVADGVSDMQAMRSIYDGHNHDAPGGATDPPNQPMG